MPAGARVERLALGHELAKLGEGVRVLRHGAAVALADDPSPERSSARARSQTVRARPRRRE